MGVIKGTELADPQYNRKREEHVETNPFRDIGNAASTGEAKGEKNQSGHLDRSGFPPEIWIRLTASNSAGFRDQSAFFFFFLGG